MSNNQFGFLRSALCAVICGLFGMASAQATIVPTYEIHGTPVAESPTQTYFPAVPNLLTGSTPSSATSGDLGSSIAGLTDGNVGSFNSLANTLFYNGHTGSVLIPLVTPSNIGQIRSISGWTDDRINQLFDVYYTTDAAPTVGSSFTLIGTSAPTFPQPGGGGHSLQVTFGDGISSIVGSSLVTALRFDFTAASGNNPVYREIEAFAPVPEPTSLSLLATGVVALVFRRRRK